MLIHYLSIVIILYLIIILIDIHSSLSSIIEKRTIPSGLSSCSYIHNLKMDSSSLSIPDSVCNSELLISFDLSIFKLLKTIIIGNTNFFYVNGFILNNNIKLNSLKIGKNSFTKYRNSHGNDSSRSFHISNCIELQSIEIDNYSFSDYGGEFELKNLPKLVSIIMGETGEWSSSFYYSTLVIRGNRLCVVFRLDFPNLYVITLGNDAFATSSQTIIESM